MFLVFGVGENGVVNQSWYNELVHLMISSSFWSMMLRWMNIVVLGSLFCSFYCNLPPPSGFVGGISLDFQPKIWSHFSTGLRMLSCIIWVAKPVLEVILQVLHDRIGLNPAMSKYASAPDHGYFFPANNFTDVFGHPKCLFDRKSASVIKHSWHPGCLYSCKEIWTLQMFRA